MQQRDTGSRLRRGQQQEDDQAGYPHVLLCPGEGQREEWLPSEQHVQADAAIQAASTSTGMAAAPKVAAMPRW